MSLNDEILQNNQELSEVLNTINTLPKKENITPELSTQTDLLAQLQEILSGKAAGGGDAFGYIMVKYPAGSNCGIVPNDELNAGITTSTILAKTTDGFYVFPVPSAGDWFVGCWTGDDPLNAPEYDNKVVTISADNPYAYAELSYALYLIKDGVTSGTWENNNASVSKQYIDGNYVFRMSSGSTFGPGYYELDLSGYNLSSYNTLYLDGYYVGADDNVPQNWPGTLYLGTETATIASIDAAGKTRDIVSLDVSAIDFTETKYLGFTTPMYDGGVSWHRTQLYVYNLWFE